MLTRCDGEGVQPLGFGSVAYVSETKETCAVSCRLLQNLVVSEQGSVPLLLLLLTMDAVRCVKQLGYDATNNSKLFKMD